MSVDVNTIAQPLKRRVSQLGEIEKKAIVIEALQLQGYGQNEAAKLINCDTGYVSRIKKRQATGALGTLAPLAKLAKRAVKATLKGEQVGQADAPKASDVLNASKMVLDRTDPVIQRHENKNLNVSVELSAEERLGILSELGMIPVNPSSID